MWLAAKCYTREAVGMLLLARPNRATGCVRFNDYSKSWRWMDVGNNAWWFIITRAQHMDDAKV